MKRTLLIIVVVILVLIGLCECVYPNNYNEMTDAEYRTILSEGKR